MAERELAMSRLAHDTNVVRQVRAARHRIRDGTFGACVRCEEPIPDKRLAAVPWTALCLACQEEADQRGAPSSEAA